MTMGDLSLDNGHVDSPNSAEEPLKIDISSMLISKRS